MRLRLVLPFLPPPLTSLLLTPPSPRFFNSRSMAKIVPSASVSSSSMIAEVSDGSSISSIGSSFSLCLRRSGEIFSLDILIFAFKSSSDAFAMPLSFCRRNTRSVASGSEASSISSVMDSLEMRSSSAASSPPAEYCVCNATPPKEVVFVSISTSCSSPLDEDKVAGDFLVLTSWCSAFK